MAQQTIDALKKNDLAKDSTLYIFSDGPRDEKNAAEVEEVRKYINGISGFRDVIINESATNNGLGKSIISGVNQVFEQHDRIIVLEDDLISSPDFLAYSNEALDFYKNQQKIYSISGYFPPVAIGDRQKSDVCFIPRISSLGWSTWKNRWVSNKWDCPEYSSFIKSSSQKKRFSRAGRDMLQMLINQLEGNATAWAIRCDFNRFINGDALTVYPCISKIHHIGNDGRGTNTPDNNLLDVELSDGSIHTILKPFQKEDEDIATNFRNFYPHSMKSELIILLRRFGLYKYVKR